MYRIQIQRACKQFETPSAIDLKKWAKAALRSHIPAAEITIRITDESEIVNLNLTYRHKNKPTNILSFPFTIPPNIEMDTPLLGDLVVCAEVVETEALAQHKTLAAHWAHMIIHGTLHLLGFDHEVEAEATIMEAEEIRILATLGFSNPYALS